MYPAMVAAGLLWRVSHPDPDPVAPRLYLQYTAGMMFRKVCVIEFARIIAAMPQKPEYQVTKFISVRRAWDFNSIIRRLFIQLIF